MYQLEGRDFEGAPWVRYPIIFTGREEAGRACDHLRSTSVAGWPEYRIVCVDTAGAGFDTGN